MRKAACLTFYTHTKRHDHFYLYERFIEPNAVGLLVTGWLWHLLQASAKESVTARYQDAQVHLLHSALKALSKNEPWLEYVNIPLKSLSTETATYAIEAMEHGLAKSAIPLSDVGRRASRLRVWIIKGLMNIGLPRAERIPNLYSPAFPVTRGTPRKLISDLPSDTQATAQYPTGATPHKTLNELKATETERHRQTLIEIERACLAAIESHQQSALTLRSKLPKVKPHLIKEITTNLNLKNPKTPKATPNLSHATPEEIAAAYFIILNDKKFWLNRGHCRLVTSGTKNIFNTIEKILATKVARYRLTELMIEEILSQQLMTAIYLLIQCHTGWNSNTVLEISRDTITETDRGFIIKGYKSRTDTWTPEIEVLREDNAYIAISMLMRRSNWLIACGWIAKTERRLWLNSVSIQNAETPRSYIGWDSALRAFQRKYALPNFSPEQVRAQKLAVDALQDGGLDKAQARAQHKELNTTAHYLEQEMFHRLRSSVNLEYQRRAEIAISSHIKGKDRPEEQLFFDIGDGTKCKDPYSPPDSNPLINDRCSAERCNSGSGCPNRVIHVDRDSMIAAIRTKIFYSSNWIRLYTENVEYFHLVHFPQMEFNLALLEVIARGRHRGTLRKLYAELGEK